MPSVPIVEVDADSPLMSAVFALRHEVFVVEQAFAPELERDEFDHAAIQLAALHDEQVVGTLRLILLGQTAKLGRVAVRASVRGSGIGTCLMERAAVIAAEHGIREIALHAQLAVAPFYRRMGYREEGDAFDEAGMPHIAMRKPIR